MTKPLQRIFLMGIITSMLAACAGERPQNLGSHNGQLSACPGSPNCVSSQASDERHRIAPLTSPGDPQQLWTNLKAVLRQRDDTTMVQEEADYLRVEFHTTFFVDDGEFLLDAAHRQIHLRSASRLGYSDLGKNRRRLEQIRQSLAAATAD